MTPTSMMGSYIGSYQVKRRLGVGAMGEVYLGEHPTLGRQVAIKILRKEVSTDQELVKRFFAEAQALSALRHPNIVKALDLSVLPDGRTYYVTEYLEGQSLLQLIQEKKQLDFAEAKPIIKQLLQALSAAHQKGIIHRDIKPANIFLVSTGGTPLLKLLDFGIAKLQDKSGLALSGVSVPGVVLGTPAYMAPEQCTGKDIQPASDLYSVGVVLFELLTGSLPFGLIDDQQLMEAHVRKKPPLLRGKLPSASPALEAFLQRSFEKSIKARFTSAEEMLSALEEIPEPLPISAVAQLEKKDITCKDEVIAVPALDDEPSIGPVITASNKSPEKRSWVVGGLAALVLLAGGIFLLQSPGASESKPLSSAAQPAPVSSPTPTPAPAQPVAQEPAAPTPVIEAPKMALMTIEAEPKEASIQIASLSLGEKMSTGNLELQLPIAESVAVTVSLDGYQTEQRTIPAKAGVFQISLSPLETKQETPKVKAQPAKTKTPPTKESSGEPKRRYTPPPIAPREGLD